MLVKSGAFAIEQLSEALSSSSDSDKLSDGVSDDALRLCSEQVRLCVSTVVYYFNFNFVRMSSPQFLRHIKGIKGKWKKSFCILLFSVFSFQYTKHRGKWGK